MSEASETRHLCSIEDLGRDGILQILDLTDSFSEVSDRAIPKVPALRGKTVATLFFEASTRTRLSFETAAKRLSADTMTFTASTSSVQKGESLRDTVETIDAMGVDAMVVRHESAGVPSQIARWVSASIINAGDGAHEHPTQALLDCYTIKEALSKDVPRDDLTGVRIAIVGDVHHSRVARSNVLAFKALGAEITLVGPSTLLPIVTDDPAVAMTHDLDGVLGETDVVYLLRLQSERMTEALLPSLGEYRERFGLTRERAAALRKGTIVMHPGPINRGVEVDAEVTSMDNVLVTRQVRNGVAVRMAVLFSLLSSPTGRVVDGTDENQRG